MRNARSEALDLVARCQDRYGPYTSSHEGFGVLSEEVGELLHAIRKNDRESVRTEAIQVAAVAIKLALDCDDEEFRLRSGMTPGRVG